MNKKLKYLPAVAAAFAIGFALNGGVHAQGFEDMPKENHWSYRPIRFCLDKNYLKGMDAVHIAPGASLTRGQMAAIMNRVKGTSEKADISAFKDVKVQDWFYDDIAKAVKAGFISGRSASEMAPNAKITREEAFTILARVLGEKEAKQHLNAFKDGKDVAPWAAKGVNSLVDQKIVNGDNGSLRPKDGITRAEFAQIVFQAFGKEEAPQVQEGVLFGDANVDQQQYPAIAPFIHPPFYNVRVKVTVGKDGKIQSVEDNETIEKGLAPGMKKDFFEKKNAPFFNQLKEQKFYDKVKGLDRAGVEALKVNHGEVDALTGATETGKAFKQAILNAFDKKEGKKFLSEKETLVAEKPMVTKQGVTVHFKNNLPKDFKVKLVSVNAGIYNGENVIDSSKIQWKAAKDGFDLTIAGDLKAGKYMVNIVDESGKYRSPDFESGHGSPRKYPFFVIEKGAKLAYKDGKLTISDNDYANFQQNIEEIVVTPLKGNEPIKDKAMDIEPVGHHGTKGDYQKNPMFLKDGSISEAVTFGRKKAPVFMKGVSYKIEVETYGYGTLEFTYTAKEGIKEGEGKKDGSYTGKAPVGSFGYDFIADVTVKDGKITAIKDNTKPDGESAKRHNAYIDAKMLDKFVGKDAKEVKGMADTVSGATATSKAAQEAILNALK